ncbi:lipid homeostasis protein [Malassezia pachydermatis]
MDATPDASLMDIDPDVGPTFTAMPVEQSHAALPGQVIPVSSNPMVPFTASSPPSRDAAVGTPPTGTPAPASSAPPQTSGSASDAPKEGWSIVKSSADLVAAASLPTKAVAPYRHAASAAVASQARSLLERPETFLTYVQVLFNASIILVFIYLLFSVVWTIQHDVSLKVKEYELDYLGEIASCSSAYTANRCGSDMQAPALTEACEAWRRCAARDPTVVGRARVTAETFAEILNGFVDVVSWKTMLFSLLTLSIVVGATNSTLSFFRFNASQRNDPPPSSTPSSHPPYYPYALPPEWDTSALRHRIRPQDDQETRTIPYRTEQN